MKNKSKATSSPFDVNEITNLPTLVAKLSKPEIPVHRYIRDRLTCETQQLLNVYGGNCCGAEALSSAIAIEFARIIGGESIYEPSRFEGVELSKKAQQALHTNLTGQALERHNRLLLECVFPGGINKRFNGKKQVRIRVGPGLFRIAGEDGIHGKIKIAGKTYGVKLTATNDSKEARKAYEQWVVGLRKTLAVAVVKKGTLKSYVPAYCASRKEEVDLGHLTQGRLDDLHVQFQHLEAHWPSFATLDSSELMPSHLSKLRTYLLRDARNRAYKDSAKAPVLSKSTYNSYIIPLALLLKYLFTIEVLTAERYLKLKAEIKYATVPPREVEIPTDEQLKKMRAYLYRIRQGPKAGDAGPKFDFMMLSGARLESANASGPEHYDPVSRTLLFTKLKARAGQPTEKRVPICAEMAELLDRMIKVKQLRTGDKFFKAGNNNRAFKSAATKAGLKRWFHHACRDWFGTITLFQTHDPIATADLMCQNDKGVTLIKVYRQICAGHLRSTVGPLKLYAGAKADSSLRPALLKAEKAVANFGNLPTEHGALALDRVLWIASKVDAGDFAAVTSIPGLAQETLSIYAPQAVRELKEPSPALIKNNLRYLLTVKGVYHSDVAAATGIKRSVIAVAARSGNLQARCLPALCKYFGVNMDDFLHHDLSGPVTTDNSQDDSGGTKQAEPCAPFPDLETVSQIEINDIVLQHDPYELQNIVSRNLASMILERNLTAHSLSLKAGLAGAVVHSLIHRETMPTDETSEKLAAALSVQVTDIYDAKRDNINVVGSILIANIKAIIANSGMASTTYFVRLKMGDKSMKEVLKTGQIAASQAHRLVEANRQKLSLRELVSQDVTSRFPPVATIDPIVVSNNLTSLTWERGMYITEIARKADITMCSGLNYAQGKSRRIHRRLLTKVAESVGLSLAELVDPSRPVLKPTKHFAANLQSLIDHSGVALTSFGEACGIESKVLRLLLEGQEPNPHQVAKISRYLNISPKALFTEDVCLYRDSSVPAVISDGTIP